MALDKSSALSSKTCVCVMAIDPYTDMASTLFKKPHSAVTMEERADMKAAFWHLLYCGPVEKLSARHDLSTVEIERAFRECSAALGEMSREDQ